MSSLTPRKVSTKPLKMSRAYRRKPQSMLEYVIKAISNLKDSYGSNARNIVRHINSTKRPNRKTGITSQVRSALKQGARSGALVHRAGKYKLPLRQCKYKPILRPKYYAPAQQQSTKKRPLNVYKPNYRPDNSSVQTRGAASKRRKKCCNKNSRKRKNSRKTKIVTADDSGHENTPEPRKSDLATDVGNVIVKILKLKSLGTNF